MNTVQKLDSVLDVAVNEFFMPDYVRQTPANQLKEEALGILVSQWTEWDGLAIMRVFFSALEDANFHSEAGLVLEMIERTKELFEES